MCATLVDITICLLYTSALHERFKLAQAAFSSLNDRTQESLTSIRMIKALDVYKRQVIWVG